MAITNISKPSVAPGDFLNINRPNQGFTWATIQTTWATETESWDEASQIIDNASRPASSITNIAKPA